VEQDVMSSMQELLKSSYLSASSMAYIDELYDAPPNQAGANRIAKVTNFADLADIEIGGVGSSGVGSGGMVTKIQAAEIATSSGASMLLTDLAHLDDALSGKDVGTLFTSN
jgi:glutamate 5-kinase